MRTRTKIFIIVAIIFLLIGGLTLYTAIADPLDNCCEQEGVYFCRGIPFIILNKWINFKLNLDRNCMEVENE